MSDHAVFAPSAASTWLRCPASAVWAKQFVRRKSGPAAEKGTALHEEAAKALLNGKRPRKKLLALYCDTVMKAYHSGATFLRVEQRVALPGAEEDCWGTLDAGLEFVKRKEAKVFDLKSGAHAVEAKHNAQLLVYASGLTPAKKYELIIVQDAVRRWSFDAAYLRKFVRRARSAVLLGKENNPRAIPGDYCTFCSAKQFCPARLRAKPMRVGEPLPTLGEDKHAWFK